MNDEKKRYITGKVCIAASALTALLLILFLLLRPVAPSGVYVNAGLESTLEFGEDMSVRYTAGARVLTGTAVKRGDVYRCALSDGSGDIVLTVRTFKGYVEVSDGDRLDGAVFSRGKE